MENIASSLNEVLLEETEASVFVTLLMILVDPTRGRLHYIRAGHNPPILVNQRGNVTVLSEGGGVPLGILPHQRYTRQIKTVEPGTVVVIYSDGVTEARNGSNEEFGESRVGAVVQSQLNSSAQNIHDRIRQELQAFMQGGPAHDDSTLAVLKF